MMLREYIDTDKNSLIELDNKALSEVKVEGLPNHFSDLENIEFNYLKNGVFVVAEIDGDLIGMGGLRVIEPGTARINRMRVHPNLQGKGIGHEILVWLEDKAKIYTINKILLNTLKAQTKAQKFYESHGYTKIGEGSPDGFKVVMYEKYI
jgi:GNAT superfamily N-acetyltransferase